MDLNYALRETMAVAGEVASYLWERGWAERNAGNLSMDVTDLAPRLKKPMESFPRQEEIIAYPELGGRVFLVTATGSRLRDLRLKPAETLLLVAVPESLDGYRVLWGKDEMPAKARRATSEFVSHLKIHGLLRQRGYPQRAVLHTHPNHLVAMTHMERFKDEKGLNRILWGMHPEMKVFLPEGVGLAPYRRPGSEALADATLEALRDHRVVLWEKHGCVAVGHDLLEAFDLIDTVNKSAEIFFIVKGAGEEPEGLNQAQLRDLDATFGSRRGAG